MSLTGKTVSDGIEVLRGKIKRLSPYALDKTLTLADTAAESLAVGEELKKKLDVAKVADDLATDDPGKVLSAKQGKNLKDQIELFKQDSLQQHNLINENIGKVNSYAESAGKTAENAMAAAEKAQRMADTAKQTAENALPNSGGKMTGNLDMGGMRVIGLAPPEEDGDAASLKFVKDCVSESHEGKRLLLNTVIPVSGWIGSTAPYTQNIQLADILATDTPHIAPVYSDSLATALLEKESWNYINNCVTSDGFITFTCFEERPVKDVSIQIEVMR